MRRLFIILFLLIPIFSYAQEKKTAKRDTVVVLSADGKSILDNSNSPIRYDEALKQSPISPICGSHNYAEELLPSKRGQNDLHIGIEPEQSAKQECKIKKLFKKLFKKKEE